MSNKLNREIKNRYELLAMEWTRKENESNADEAQSLKNQLLEIERELGMTADEIIASNPKQ